MNTNHEKNFIHFCQYLEEDIDTPLCQELIQHLKECPDCKQNITSIQKTVELYRNSTPDVRLSQEMKKKLVDRIIHSR